MRKAFCLALFLGLLCTLYGQNNPEKRPVDDLKFKIAVYGPSDEIFIWWGHAALVIENTRWGYSRVFDWGIFTYPGDNFLDEFLKNEVRYKCTVDPWDVDMYIGEDRDVTVYTLALDPDKKEAILNYAENNVLPENCYYEYHELRDNCSTRIRDIIDMGTGGQLKEQFYDAPGRFSFRQHIRRFTWSKSYADWFLDSLMGQDLDEPISVWSEMFLPVEIGRNIINFKYTGASGTERKLVSSVEIINATKSRQPVLSAPLRRWPRDLTLSLLLAALAAGLHTLRGKKAGRILWGISQSLLGLGLGISGCVLVFGWFFMSNDYIQQNINLLFINPLLLAVVPLGILSAVKPSCPKVEKCLHILWAYVFFAGIFAFAVKITPVFFQQNQAALSLVLPPASVFCFFSRKKIKAEK
jgi:hypothetical protein